jgi:AcrR family transcriptional regulator
MAQGGWGSPDQSDRDDDRLTLLLWLLAEKMWQFDHRNNDRTPAWAIRMEDRFIDKLGNIMATLQEALDGWRAYVADLKAQIATAVEGLTAAQAAAQTAADALVQFQADETAKDASALAAQAQADADAVAAALDAVKTPVVEPPVITEPIEPPAE